MNDRTCRIVSIIIFGLITVLFMPVAGMIDGFHFGCNNTFLEKECYLSGLVNYCLLIITGLIFLGLVIAVMWLHDNTEYWLWIVFAVILFIVFGILSPFFSTEAIFGSWTLSNFVLNAICQTLIGLTSLYVIYLVVGCGKYICELDDDYGW